MEKEMQQLTTEKKIQELTLEECEGVVGGFGLFILAPLVKALMNPSDTMGIRNMSDIYAA
jgi:hypothetical protein